MAPAAVAVAVAAGSRALPPPPAIRAGWAMFETSVLTVTGEVAAAGAAAASTTSDGHDVVVSLRLADPPAASYVEMRIDAELRGKATVVAADGDLLLIHVTIVGVRDDDPRLSSYEENHFVYRAHPVSPSLRLLPCHEDWALYTGIAARRHDGEEEDEEEEFVAAAFRTEITDFVRGSESPDDCEEVGKVTRFSSSTGRYEVLDLPIPFDPSKGLYKLTWGTDKVLSFRGLMCFVDYHRGILLCDVFAASPELRFLPLPEIEVWDDTHDYCYGRGLPGSYRTVGVSQGLMKFVDISDGLFGRRRNPFGVSITAWTLRTPEMEWEKDGVLQVQDLWSFHEFRGSPLPRRAPELPAVCKHDPDVVHFALLDPKNTRDNAWAIMVDMRQMELQAYIPYTDQAEEGDYENGFFGCLLYDTPLICSDLGNFRSDGSMEDACR